MAQWLDTCLPSQRPGFNPRLSHEDFWLFSYYSTIWGILFCGGAIFDFLKNSKVACTAPILGLPPGIFVIILAPKLKEEKRLKFLGAFILWGGHFRIFWKSKPNMHWSYIRATPWYFFYNFSIKIVGGEASKLFGGKIIIIIIIIIWRRRRRKRKPKLSKTNVCLHCFANASWQ